ncbi:MAG: hypothetical protein Q4G40_00560 [Brachybacterium sp.]|nr:hypothetical protein [Brachybacterium sp.]
MTRTTLAPTRPTRRLAGAVLVLALALPGCSMGLGDTPESSDPPSIAEDGTEDENGENDGDAADAEQIVADDGAEEAGIDVQALGDPVATVEIPAAVEGDPEATLTAELYPLERRGDTVLATVAFSVTSEMSSDDRWLYHYLGDRRWTPHAIDTVNLRKHEVMGGRGGAQLAQTDSQGAKFRPGETFYAYAVFAAPPADVETMDVMVVEGAPLVKDVELT